MTKPLQGELFRKFRALLMNIPADVSDEEMGNPPADYVRTIEEIQNCPQECVGSNGNVRSGTESVVDRQGCNRTNDTVSKNYIMESREKKGKKVRMRIYNTDVTKLSYAAVVCKNM